MQNLRDSRDSEFEDFPMEPETVIGITDEYPEILPASNVYYSAYGLKIHSIERSPVDSWAFSLDCIDVVETGIENPEISR